MSDLMETTALQLEYQTLEHAAERFGVPCHEGEMILRRWSGPDDAETLILVHGGSGSWSHWFRNITFLQQSYHVIAVDLPGLGDSSALPSGYSAADAVDVLVNGLGHIDSNKPFHMVAFSWGCAVSSQAAAQLGNRLQSLMLVGAASLGDVPRRGGMKPLIRRTAEMSESEVYATNHENLARLMFYDRSRIDDMAVFIQTLNTRKARFNSPQFARTKLVLEGVAQTTAPTKVVYGQFDAPALPDIQAKLNLIAAVRNDIEFEIVPDAGHWLPYERPKTFNALVQRWLSKHPIED